MKAKAAGFHQQEKLNLEKARDDAAKDRAEQEKIKEQKKFIN